ncbi:uncharacterized protein LOC116944391 isoform X2 [Petromyzon marinus]|uniref:uncharacterized protein LOC116944391 isoform X2 n=1 Tax=Petromyzon marinus TaxID=7757 RepID=UPI003F72FBEF
MRPPARPVPYTHTACSRRTPPAPHAHRLRRTAHTAVHRTLKLYKSQYTTRYSTPHATVHHATEHYTERRSIVPWAVCVLGNVSGYPDLKSCFRQEQATAMLVSVAKAPIKTSRISCIETLARIVSEEDTDLLNSNADAVSGLIDAVNKPTYKMWTPIEDAIYVTSVLYQTLAVLSTIPGIRLKTYEAGAVPVVSRVARKCEDAAAESHATRILQNLAQDGEILKIIRGGEDDPKPRPLARLKRAAVSMVQSAGQCLKGDAEKNELKHLANKNLKLSPDGKRQLLKLGNGWSRADVQLWLKVNGLEEFGEKFAKFDGKRLLQLLNVDQEMRGLFTKVEDDLRKL